MRVTAMSPAELRECLDIIRWSNREIADQIGVSEKSIRLWLAGRYPIPLAVGEWLTNLAEAIRANPAPTRDYETLEWLRA